MSTSMYLRQSRAGFTLLELMVVIGIIGILTSLVLVYITPRKHLASAHDVTRTHSATQLQNAMFYYLIDHEYHVAAAYLTNCAEADRLTCGKAICREGVSESDCVAEGAVSLDALMPNYMTILPEDVVISDTDRCSGYMVYLNGNSPIIFNPNMGKLAGETPEPESLCGTISGGGTGGGNSGNAGGGNGGNAGGGNGGNKGNSGGNP